MNFEEYKRKLIEEDERERLAELQTKYYGMGTPDYSNMSLHDQLQTRFDLNELNNLQQKYGTQQTPISQPQITTPVPQSTYTAPTQPAVQQPTPQPSTWDNALRKAEQLASGALDGLSLGWADELEGAASAFGYGLASFNPNWNKTGESVWDAMKRGYVQGRDNRRQVLEQGLQENPVAVGLAQTVGAITAPVGHTNIMKSIPRLNKIGKALQNPLVSGSVAGLGTGQGNWQNQITNTALGGINGLSSNYIAGKIGNNISYTPKNYTNGNVVHNMLQPVFYTGLDKLMHR